MIPTRAAARSAARARHPSSVWRPDQDRLRDRLAAQLQAGGHPEPMTAATLMSIRGRLGMDRAAFCRLTGVDPAVVSALEDGTCERK